MQSVNRIELEELSYYGRIYINDWPLGILNKWCASLIRDGTHIRPEVLEAIIIDYELNKSYTLAQFREYLYRKMKCGGKICRETCGYECATANNLKHRLLNKNLDRFCNFKQFEKDVLNYYFLKLNDLISKNLTKYKIGVLVIMPDNIEDMFIKQETDLINYQLINQFYASDYSMIKKEKIFHHIKQYIDVVVIIVDSHYAERNNEHFNTVCTILNQFPFLKIFFVKTEDAANIDNVKIKQYYEDFLPKSEFLFYHWLAKPEGFPDEIRAKLSMMTRLKIALCSQFIFKSSTEH